MDPKLNPYSPGAGSRPPELAGRGEILEACEVALARTVKGAAPRGMLLTGLRGVGKTVLLNVIHDQAANEDFVADLVEAPEGSPLAPLIIPSLRKALLRLSTKAKARDIIDQGLRVLRSFQLSTNLGGVDYGLKFDPEIGIADSGNLERDLLHDADLRGAGMAGLEDKRGFIDRQRLDLSERQAVGYGMKR